MPFVCSFHAAVGPAHPETGDNEIHGPNGKLTQQGEQTSVCVCKSFVAQGYYNYMYMVIVIVCVRV